MRIISITLFSLLIAGCTESKIDKLKPVVVNSKNMATVQISNSKSDYKFGPMGLSEFVDSVKFIILEESDQSLIKEVNRVFFTPEQIVVVDYELGTIFFFDWNGKYLNKISKTGRGPGEYLSISRCMFDEQRQQLIIYNLSSKKMLFYDLSGNFLREISEFSESAIIRDVVNLPNGHFLCYLFSSSKSSRSDMDARYTGLWEVDSDGKFLRNYFMYDEPLPAFYTPGVSAFQLFPDGSVNLKDQIHNDIYHYHNGVVERKISYDINGNKLPDLIGIIPLNVDEYNIFADIAQEKGDYLITRWFAEWGHLFSLFSKKSREVRYWDAYSYDNAVAGVTYNVVDSNKPDILVCELNKNVINDNYLTNQNLPEAVRDTLESVVREAAESDNPILELLYIKRSSY